MCPTAFVPLNSPSSSSSISQQPCLPTFIRPCSDSSECLQSAISAIKKAKRIVVLCGAGISVEAGIPDFRSSEGLFQAIKKDNPNQALSSGKDLFHASVFKSPETTSLFNTMIANLSDLSSRSAPTSFHTLLKALDRKGKLLRVYTQNIDGLEQKAGLTFGVPDWQERRPSVNRRASKGKERADVVPSIPSEESLPSTPDDIPSSLSCTPNPSPPPEAGPSVSKTSVPRCVPLHGDLRELHCLSCSHMEPLAPHVAALSAGSSIVCPSCVELESTRRLVGKRERGVGHLRPAVVLYGETHRHDEIIGECVRRDLMGIQSKTISLPSWESLTSSRKGKAVAGSTGRSKAGAQPDLLIVAGTSLKIPGTKRIVREFSKAVKTSGPSNRKTATTSPLVLPTPRQSPTPEDDTESSVDDTQNFSDTPIKSIFLNMDFPLPARDWENVFDVWVQGDLQSFASMVHKEFEHDEELLLQKARDKDERLKKKVEKEEAKKRKAVLGKEECVVSTKTPPKKKQKKSLAALPTPPPTITKSTQPIDNRPSVSPSTGFEKAMPSWTTPTKKAPHPPLESPSQAVTKRRIVEVRFPYHALPPPPSRASSFSSPRAGPMLPGVFLLEGGAGRPQIPDRQYKSY